MGNQYTAQRDTIANLRQQIRDLQIENELLRHSRGSTDAMQRGMAYVIELIGNAQKEA